MLYLNSIVISKIKPRIYIIVNGKPIFNVVGEANTEYTELRQTD